MLMEARSARLHGRLGDLRRWTLVAVVVVHVLFPFAFAWALVTQSDGGHADGAGALVVLPFVFLVAAAVVAPLTWLAWRGRQIPAWLLLLFVALEAWLYWNGIEHESWDTPDASNRLATFQFATHAAALVALAVVNLASSVDDASAKGSGS